MFRTEKNAVISIKTETIQEDNQLANRYICFSKKKNWIKLVDEVNQVIEKLLYGCHNIKRSSFTSQDALVILRNIFSVLLRP